MTTASLNKNDILTLHNALAAKAGKKPAKWFKSHRTAAAHLKELLEETEKKSAAPSGNWVRYVSPTDPKYTIRISLRNIERLGPPKDPWGKKMVPAK